jgi:hypothetical protein
MIINIIYVLAAFGNKGIVLDKKYGFFLSEEKANEFAAKKNKEGNNEKYFAYGIIPNHMI